MAAESTRQLGENIRAAREAAGMTQQEVALAMSGQVSGDRVSKWERGENRPRDETLDDLARVLKTTSAELHIGTREPNSTPSPFVDRDALHDRLERIERRLNEIYAILTGQPDPAAEHHRGIVEGVPPTDPQDPSPDPPPNGDARS